MKSFQIVEDTVSVRIERPIVDSGKDYVAILLSFRVRGQSWEFPMTTYGAKRLGQALISYSKCKGDEND